MQPNLMLSKKYSFFFFSFFFVMIVKRMKRNIVYGISQSSDQVIGFEQGGLQVGSPYQLIG